jgi:phage tail-like protein
MTLMNIVTQPPLVVSHIADQHRRYVGEPVTLWTRVTVNAPLKGLIVQVRFPQVLTPEDEITPSNIADRTEVNRDATRDPQAVWDVQWRFSHAVAADTTLDFGVQARVQHTFTREFREFVGTTSNSLNPFLDREREIQMTSYASAGGLLTDDKTCLSEESTTLALSIASRYVQYLPGLYRGPDNDLLGRFLMNAESFWQPIERQLNHIEVCFDADLTPRHVLPWLGSWGNEVLDEQWPEAKQRQLVSAIMKYRQRHGTRQAMEEHVQLYTGFKPQIHEHRASNLRLGEGARLGAGIAIGTSNQPHTFSVVAPLVANSDAELKAQEPVVRAIIEAEKPAHTRLAQLELKRVTPTAAKP